VNAAPGAVLAHRYRLDYQLGVGGMGEVWCATDLQLSRAVALKLVLPAILARADSRARFEREARVGAALNHPHIVHTLDFGIDRETSYLVLELVVGGTLTSFCGVTPLLDQPTLVRFGYQIADALAAAHAIGLVHRDLKPDNVLLEVVDGVTRVRWADFGMAFPCEPADPRQGRLTHDGTSAGTPEYMAPEQTAGGVLGPPVDVYALGCLLFELASGRTPFIGAVGKVIAAHLYAPVPRLRSHRDDALPGLDDLIGRMLAKHPADRPTAEAVRRRLGLIGGDWLDPAARARDGTVASDRASRMMPTTPPAFAAKPDLSSVAIEVIGALDEELLVALAAGGIRIGAAPDVGAIVILGGSLAAVAAACLRGLPVLADAARDDFRRISDLLRVGVAEVVLLPLVPASLVRKLARVLPVLKEA